MAVTANSTRAPSRRAFLSSAVAAGAAAAQPPIFTVAAADTALLALAASLTGLISTADAAARRYSAAEALFNAHTGPAPTAPKGRPYSPTAAAWLEKTKVHDKACRAFEARCREAEKRYGLEGIAEASDLAESAVVKAGQKLALIPATTLAGIVAKAKLAERANWDEMSVSIVEDLIAIAG